MNAPCSQPSGSTLAWPVLAAAGEDARVECDAAEPFSVLQASAGPVDARALWLDRHQLQWPGTRPAEGERFRLHFSAAGALKAEAGEPVRGADASYALQDAAALPMPQADRFRHLAAGVRVALADDDAAA